MVALINKWIRNQAVHIITKNESYPGFEAVEAAELSALVSKKKKKSHNPNQISMPTKKKKPIPT